MIMLFKKKKDTRENFNFGKALIAFMLLFSMVFNSFNVVEANNTKTMTVTIGEGAVDQNNLSKTINIPNLKSIVKITSNTGNATYTVSGDSLTINASGGTPSRTVNNSTKYSKTVTDSKTSTANSFSSTTSYNSGGYSGTLGKDGASTVISGSYTAAQSRNETATRTTQGSNTTPATVSYNSGGYSGTLSKTNTTSTQVQTGGSTSDSKFVTGQTSSSYNSGGYSGTLDKYVYSGEAPKSKVVTDTKTSQGSNTNPSTISYNSDGYSGTLTKGTTTTNTVQTGGSASKSKYISDYHTGYYNVDGYSGNLSSVEVPNERVKSVTERTCGHPSSSTPPSRVWYDDGSYKGYLPFKDAVQDVGTTDCFFFEGYVDGYSIRYSGTVWTPDTRTYRTDYTSNYSGTVYTPDTRVYRYEGTVTKPDTRTYRTDYTANYSGTVTKPAVDTRVWQQEYKGTVYKPGDDNYYSYTVTIEYTDNSNPELEISSPAENNYFGKESGKNTISLEATIKDSDAGDVLKTYYRIDGTAGQAGTEFGGNITADGKNQTIKGTIPSNIVIILQDGTHTLYMWVEDNKGGKSSEDSVGFFTDKASPVLNIKVKQ